MFAYCENNPVRHTDSAGTCFYDAYGNWCHDNWEFIGDYVRKPAPHLKGIESISTGSVFIADRDTEPFAVSRGSVIVYDKRTTSSAKENNFEVLDSHNIKIKEFQKEICEAIIAYNEKNDYEQYRWNRNVESMIVEWDWHNKYYENGIFIESSRSVNFDMGTFANTKCEFAQKLGYLWEKYVR
jgi:hypothetical protein